MADNNTVPNPPRLANVSSNPSPIVYQGTSVVFNGYAWLGLTLPPATGSYSYRPQLFNTVRRQQIPQFVKVPVLNGIIDTTTMLFWNSDIDPPGTQVVAYWFDDNDVLLAPALGTAVPFSVGSFTQVLTVPPLVPPSFASTVPPVPEM